MLSIYKTPTIFCFVVKVDGKDIIITHRSDLQTLIKNLSVKCTMLCVNIHVISKSSKKSTSLQKVSPENEM